MYHVLIQTNAPKTLLREFPLSICFLLLTHNVFFLNDIHFFIIKLNFNPLIKCDYDQLTGSSLNCCVTTFCGVCSAFATHFHFFQNAADDGQTCQQWRNNSYKHLQTNKGMFYLPPTIPKCVFPCSLEISQQEQSATKNQTLHYH